VADKLGRRNAFSSFSYPGLDFGLKSGAQTHLEFFKGFYVALFVNEQIVKKKDENIKYIKIMISKQKKRTLP